MHPKMGVRDAVHFSHKFTHSL